MTETSEVPSVVQGDRILVTRYYASSTEFDPPHERIVERVPDIEGDVRVASDERYPGDIWAHDWVKAPAAEPDDIEWNPHPNEGETIWVYEYYRGHAITGEHGYDVRVAAVTYPDSEGDLNLVDVPGKGSYARKWRRPDGVDTPENDGWNPRDLSAEDAVWVYDYYVSSYRVNERGYDERKALTGVVDADGDLLLVSDPDVNNCVYARRWRRAGNPVPEAPVEDDGWNPRDLEEGDLVWVYEDSGTNRGVPHGRGFDIRTVARAEVDSDGEIFVDGFHSYRDPNDSAWGSYARKWRRPATDLHPGVSVGDKVKVLATLPGAADDYVEAVMGKVLTVASIANTDRRVVGDNNITVIMPEGSLVSEEFTTGAIAGWAVVDPATPSLSGPNAEVPTEESRQTGNSEDTIDWGVLIESWRESLSAYACDQEWCEEFEGVIMRLFGWEPTDQRALADLEVNVRLTRVVYLSDALDMREAFGAVDSDDIEVVDSSEEYSADVTLYMSASRSTGPSRDEVEDLLNEKDYKFDSFEITNWQIGD